MWSRRAARGAPVALAVFVLAGMARGASYSESVGGDLSDDRLAPTPFALELGSNSLFGGFGDGDLDYVTISITPGHELVALALDAASVLGSQFSFIAVQQGATMTVSPAVAPAGLLGWAHFSSQDFGTDLLGDIGAGLGAAGFSGPLSAGSYTFWIQELEAAEGLGYGFQLEVAPASEPAAAWLLAVGLAVARRIR